MTLYERLQAEYRHYASLKWPGHAQEHNERMESLFKQTLDWMDQAKALLARAREYSSCDIHEQTA